MGKATKGEEAFELTKRTAGFGSGNAEGREKEYEAQYKAATTERTRISAKDE
jgi:hypothetical protein